MELEMALKLPETNMAFEYTKVSILKELRMQYTKEAWDDYLALMRALRKGQLQEKSDEVRQRLDQIKNGRRLS